MKKVQKPELPKEITKEDLELLVTCIDVTLQAVKTLKPREIVQLGHKLYSLRDLLEAMTKLPFDLKLTRKRSLKKKGASL